MAHNINNLAARDLGGLPIDALLPERPAIIGEFSPAYEAFKTATLTDLESATSYEYVLALQLVDLNGPFFSGRLPPTLNCPWGLKEKYGSR